MVKRTTSRRTSTTDRHGHRVTIDRRTFLTAAAAAAAGLVALSCSDGGSDAQRTGRARRARRPPSRRPPAPTRPRHHPRPRHRAARRRATFVDTGPRNRDRVALTFHTNGDLDLAQQLLDVLSAHNVVMTSFIVGDWLDANPTWAKKITDAGHELANHTYTHPSFLTLSRDAMLDEIVRCRDVLERLSGSPGAFFRPSGTDDGTAALPDVVLDVAGEAGYRTVLGFDVDPHDYDDPGADAVVQRTLDAVGPGSIVSLHFGHPGTIAAMPAILDGLQRRRASRRCTRRSCWRERADALHRGAAGRRGPRREQRGVTALPAGSARRASRARRAMPSSTTPTRSARAAVDSRCATTIDGAVLGEPVERELDHALGTRVEARRGFVEHEDGGIGERGARERHELALAARQPRPALPHLGVEADRAARRSGRRHRARRSRPPPLRRSRRDGRRARCRARCR